MTSIFAKPRSMLREFLRSEASGGLLLMAAAALAMIVANSPLAPGYEAMLHAKLGPLSLLHWINDALMALFFFLVGLEIKREFVDGHLSTWADRRLPMIAAVAGMIVPALIYLAITNDNLPLARGWAIPAATDIAFALGVLALLGKRAPASLKLFLTTVAIVDDMGAVAIIAIAYTSAIKGYALLAALIILGMMFTANRAGVVRIRWYLVGFALLWLAVLLSGVHATIAGVLAALMIPVRMTKGAPDAEDSPLHRLEHLLHKPVAWFIIPLFGFANAGVSLGGSSPLAPLPVAIALGLFLGRIAKKPADANWAQIYGVSLLCGIGFTMSLFIGGLAFPGAEQGAGVKIGVLMGSLLSALTGYAVLRFAKPRFTESDRTP